MHRWCQPKGSCPRERESLGQPARSRAALTSPSPCLPRCCGSLIPHDRVGGLAHIPSHSFRACEHDHHLPFTRVFATFQGCLKATGLKTGACSGGLYLIYIPTFAGPLLESQYTHTFDSPNGTVRAKQIPHLPPATYLRNDHHVPSAAQAIHLQGMAEVQRLRLQTVHLD